MENRLPQTDEAKLRQELEELLRCSRLLEELSRPPAKSSAGQRTGAAHWSHCTDRFSPDPVLTTLFRSPNSGRTASFKREELAELDGMTCDYLLNYYQSQALFSPEDAARLRDCIEAHARRMRDLTRKSSWRSCVFKYEVAKEEAILRSLLQLSLLLQCLEILTPPLLTVKRIGDEEFDLMDSLRGLTRVLALTLCQRLVGKRTELQAYGALSLCIAALGSNSEDAQALIEAGYAAAKGDGNAYLKWFEENGCKALEKVEALLQPLDKHGARDVFEIFTSHMLDPRVAAADHGRVCAPDIANTGHDSGDLARRNVRRFAAPFGGDFRAIDRCVASILG